MEDVAHIWDRIHKWMTNHSPKMLDLLRPGATDGQLIEMQEVLGLNDLPEDFKASYRIHNGSTATIFFGAMKANSFFSTDEIVEEWNINMSEQEPMNNGRYERNDMHHKEIQNKTWSERWIPFGGDLNGNSICIDLDPTDTGVYGQVIQWFSGEDYAALRSSSFCEYLKKFKDDLESGRYSLSDDYGHLILIECINVL